jgi:hypothetical protein
MTFIGYASAEMFSIGFSHLWCRVAASYGISPPSPNGNNHKSEANQSKHQIGDKTASQCLAALPGALPARVLNGRSGEDAGPTPLYIVFTILRTGKIGVQWRGFPDQTIEISL